MKKNLVVIMVLGLILSLGIFLRAFNILQTTNVFSDTGRDLLVGKKLAEGNAPIMVAPYSSVGVNNTPLYFWIIGLIWKLAGTVEKSVILFAFLNSTMPFIVFFLGKIIFDKKFGLLSAFYFAIHPYFVESSRWIWQPHLLSLLTPLTLLLFIKSYSSKKYKHYFLFLFFISSNLAIHLHFSAFPIVIFLFLILAYKAILKKEIKTIGFYSLASIVLRIKTSFNPSEESVFKKAFDYIAFDLNNIKNNFLIIKNAFAESIFLKYYMEINVKVFFLIGLFFIMYSLILLFSKRKTHELSMLIAFLSIVLSLFFSKKASEYHFYPYVFIWHFILISSIYKLWQANKNIIKLMAILLFSSLVFIYSQTNYKIINGKKEEIVLYKKIAQIIYNDSQQRGKLDNNFSNDFELEIINPIYGSAYGKESHNAIVWLFLEKLSSKQFIKISKKPPVIKLNNPNTNNKYLVVIDYKNQKPTACSANNETLESFKHYNTTVYISYL